MSVRISSKDLENAKDMDIVEDKEFWNVYKLDDGTTLKVKLVLQSVKRLQKWNPDGTPIYVINSSNVVRAVGIPKNLRRKPKPSAFEPV